MNDTILTLNPLLVAQGQDTIEPLDDMGPTDTIADLYAGSPDASEFIDTSTEENLAKVLVRYEKLTKIITNIEKPIATLDQDRPIIDRPTTFNTLSNLDNPSSGLIKEMLDGAYVGTVLPENHIDQLDYIVSLFL